MSPQAFFPSADTPHRFQNVHREVAGAPGILPVSASRKYTRFNGLLLRAPPSKVRKMSRMAPAMKNRPNKPKDAPVRAIVSICRRGLSDPKRVSDTTYC